MSNTWIAALIGLVSAVLASTVGYLLARAKTRSEIRLNTVQALEIEKRITEAEAEVDVTLSGDVVEVFDSEVHGFERESFVIELRCGASGSLSVESRLATNDTIVVSRTNLDGSLLATITRYGYPGGSDVIPGSTYAGNRMMRFCCQVRSLDATCSFVLILKELTGTSGEHLGHRRYRVTPMQWHAVDEWFNIPWADRSRFRFEIRSPSAVPCTVELRRLNITDRRGAAPAAPLA